MNKLLLAAFVLAEVGNPYAQEGSVHHSVAVILLVADADRAATELAGWAEQVGGYVVRRSTTSNTLRVPRARLPELRLALERISGTVVRYVVETRDLQETLLGLESSIRSREEILDRNLDFLSRADVPATLAIEKEVAALLGEIEQMKGRLRKLEVDRRYALVTVSLGMAREELPDRIPSSFGWLNALDFYGFATSTRGR